MAFQYLNNRPLDEVRSQYISLLQEQGFAPRSETIPVQAAGGRVTAQAVYAHICAPHYPACAMDGIAVSAADTFGASDTTPIFLTPEQYMVVDTGDPLPEDRDAVIMVEEVVFAEERAVIRQAATPWQHVRQIGEDICAGEMLLPGHTSISPAAIGAMLAAGVLEVEVLAKPVVGIIPTGDEVVPPTAAPKPGDVVEFNSSIFSAMLNEWGAVPRVYSIVPDQEEALRAALTQALDQCDMVLLNAGSSAGREDYAAAVIGQVGEVFCHGIAIQPGKPAILGHQGNKPVLGVPGYPVSGIIVIEQLLRPLVDLFFGREAEQPATAQAVLSRRVVSSLKYQEFVRVRLGQVGGRLVAAPLARGSGVVSSFMKADGILEIPQGSEGLEAGAAVSVRLLRPARDLEHTLVAIGSHDPLLDELSDLLHQADPSAFMSSSHVGSMGGLMAIRRKETHMAGCHLLNEIDGTYNTATLEKQFPKGGIYQVECVGRTQGLMVAPGNPLRLSGFKDISRPGIRYVNRQKGSGTRILADYLCRKEGVDPAAVYGYEREEFTHTAVAAQIAGGTADAGMGIWSAAKIYGLDFLPVCVEQYDLIIPDYAWDSPMIRRVLEILAGPAFRARLEKLGGYTLDQPGRVRRVY